MNPRSRNVIIGMTGFFAGALAGQLSPWPTLPKAALVMVVTGPVSLLVWALLRPRSIA